MSGFLIRRADGGIAYSPVDPSMDGTQPAPSAVDGIIERAMAALWQPPAPAAAAPADGLREWTIAVAAAMQNRMTKTEAIRFVVRRFPDVHERMIDAANR